MYRDFIRHRRKKNEYREAHSNVLARRASSPDSTTQPSRPRSSSVMNNFPSSVSATHMTSPSCQMQLYYGPTSHFALMQHIYGDLIANPTAHPAPSTGVDEAGAGLDLFSFRRIFFGTPDTQDAGKPSSMGDAPVIFLPYDLAKMFLMRFLSSLYHMTPHHPPAYFESCLEQLYSPSPGKHPDTLTQATILLALAIAAVGTEYFAWGDILYERVKASLTSYDEVVNLQAVQISLLMISSVFSSFRGGFANENLSFTPITKMSRVGPILRFSTLDRPLAKHSPLGCIRMCLMESCKPRKWLKCAELRSGLFIFLKRKFVFW